MKILHVADVHLGMEFGANRMRTKSRRTELLRGFLNIVKYAMENEVTALLIAGDLFDGENVDADMLNQIKEAFALAKDVDIYIAPGNHDPLTASSPYKGEFSENVTIFDGRGRIIERPDKGYRIWGRGFENAFVSERMLMGVTLPKDDLINLGIVHGQLAGKNGHNDYNPITDGDITRSNIDYLALGHIHQRSDVAKLGSTFYAYSGTPEGQGFDEDGVKGFYCGEVTKDANELNLSFISLSERKYYELLVDVTGAENNKEVKEKTIEAIVNRAELDNDKAYENNLYKIIYTGNLSQDKTINLTLLKGELNDIFYFVKLKDKTRLLLDYEELSRENSLKGRFTCKMLEMINEAKLSGDDKKVNDYKDALEIGIRAFYGEVMVDED